MKKSHAISLVLITALLASCHKHKKHERHFFLRSDVTAGYCPVPYYYPGNPYYMWYYAFRPYGMMYGGGYSHAGYYSSAISERANIGTSGFKASIVRGGFGGTSSASVSS